jgi:hypothetical protein
LCPKEAGFGSALGAQAIRFCTPVVASTVPTRSAAGAAARTGCFCFDANEDVAARFGDGLGGLGMAGAPSQSHARWPSLPEHPR